nr:hypothetical protein [Methanobrevibacter arboriphilus]
MTSKLYYSPNMNNNYKQVRIFGDSIKDDWNKISSLQFSTNKELKDGGHVIYKSNGHDTFGGQILKSDESYGDFNNYTCLDYRTYLKTNVNYSPIGYTRSSDIVTTLLKKYAVYSNSPIKLNIKKTPKKGGFNKLVWENKSLLQIINELIYLEFINGTLIYCNIDYKGKITYIPVEKTMNIPVIRRCIDGSYSVDYSDIKTQLEVDGKVIKQDKKLTKTFGNMNTLINTEEEVVKYSPTYEVKNANDKEIPAILKAINKKLTSFEYSNNGTKTWKEIYKAGKGTSQAMADLIFTYLKKQNVKCKLVRYNTPKGKHDSVIVYYKTKWINFPTNNMDMHFKATTVSLTKNVTVVKKNG